MNIRRRWIKLLTAREAATFAARLWCKRYNEKQAHKPELGQSEDGGSSLAPSPAATDDALETTGSA